MIDYEYLSNEEIEKIENFKDNLAEDEYCAFCERLILEKVIIDKALRDRISDVYFLDAEEWMNLQVFDSNFDILPQIIDRIEECEEEAKAEDWRNSLD